MWAQVLSVAPAPERRERRKHAPQLPEQGVRCAAVVAVGMRRWVGGDINNAPN